MIHENKQHHGNYKKNQVFYGAFGELFDVEIGIIDVQSR
jgi:hypothetical protein